MGSGGRTPTRRRTSGDHPHERGERGLSASFPGSSRGSSPRAWGAVRAARRSAAPARIIPTSVGSGTPGQQAQRTKLDHPHERGERQLQWSRVQRVLGSSPRAWGAGRRQAGRQRGPGIIPTSVGSGRTRRRPGPRGWDHPHERGERRYPTETYSLRVGSSPRAWGAARSSAPRSRTPRIIPTSVGSGSGSATAGPKRTDHPHERGERAAPSACTPWASGSSPRAWGAVGLAPGRAADGGIIPTSVGSGSTPRPRATSSWDHPHERGERVLTVLDVGPVSGSSPRAWGAAPAARRRVPRPVPGSSPRAWGAGDGADEPPAGGVDHPHERGERDLGPAAGRPALGSSPRAWGAGHGRRGRPTRPGIIPTSVGSGGAGRPCSPRRTDHPHERGERAAPRRGARRSAGSSPRAWGAGPRPGRPRPRGRIIPTSVGSGLLSR